MGKSQKKKSMRRHNPVRVPDSHLPKGLSSASETSSKREAILPILEKMENPDPTERKWACVAVSNLIQNDPSTRRLLQGKNVVGTLITRLTDSEDEVVTEAVGALRNLCIDGGYEICAEMYNKNILVPLKTFIPKISTVLSQYLSNPRASPENAQKMVYEYADNVITILWCLSETSNKALTAINEIHLTPFLMSFLASRDKLPLPPAVAAAQCLYVLTDDNPPVIGEVRADASYLSCLLSIARPDDPISIVSSSNDPRLITLSILATGILRNVAPLPALACASFADLDRDIILPLLQRTITSISIPDVTNLAQELIARQESEPQIEKLSLKNAPKSDHKSSAEIELEKLETRLRTVVLALEILTGICGMLPDPEPTSEEMDEEENTEQDLEVEPYPPDVDMDTGDAGGRKASVSLPSYISALVDPLLSLIQPSSLSFPPLSAPSPYPPITSALSTIHINALECLNNVFLSLASSTDLVTSAEKAFGTKCWRAIWSALGAVGTQTTSLGQERRQQMWEIATGVLWALGKVWRGTLDYNEEQASVLIQFSSSVSDPKIKTQCIGALECIAQDPSAIEGNRAIAEYLLSFLSSPSTTLSAGEVEPLIQAISGIIDIYSDENMPYDINFRQGHYMERLSANMPGVRKTVRSIDRRKENSREIRARGNEVLENLVDFIKYRRDLSL